MPRDVSNMIGGPVVPRASKFSTTPPPAASGCEAANASAPQRQASSASVRTTTTSLRSCGPAVSARTVSSRVDTPAASSLPPGPFSTESWWAIRNSRPVESLPFRKPTTLRTRAISVEPRPKSQAPTAFCTRVSSPSPVRVATSSSTTWPSAALPATCVWAAICCTCSNARAALNSSAGASAGFGCRRLQRGDAPRHEAEEQGDQDQAGDTAGAGGADAVRRGNARQAPRHPR